MVGDYIDVDKARRELGEEGFYAVARWLRNKGYQNFTQEGENRLVHKIFITKDQLQEFISDQIKDFKGTNKQIEVLWGQTKERYVTYKRSKSRRSR